MKQRRILSLILIFSLAAALVPTAGSFAYGQNKPTTNREDALEYICSLEGTQVRVEEASVDNTAVARAYFRDIGGKPLASVLYFCGTPYAYNFALSVSDGVIPSGWKRCYTEDGYIPKPGDVAVWDTNRGIAGKDGLVGLVTEVQQSEGSCQIKYLSQPEQIAVISESFLDATDPTCYIVPLFNQEWSEEEILASKSRFTVLVLDTSGQQDFIFPPDVMKLRIRETTYSADSAIEQVKESAKVLVTEALSEDNSYVALVAFAGKGAVLSGFTDDAEALLAELDALDIPTEEDDISGGGVNVTDGLLCAETLLDQVTNPDATKGICLCTTGLISDGPYLEEGHYSKDDPDVPATWHNMETDVKLYHSANAAYAAAQRIKENGTTIYTLGVFRPIEKALPDDGKILANFFRQTLRDLATSDTTFFSVEDPADLPQVFETMEHTVDGKIETQVYTNGSEEPVVYGTDLATLISIRQSTRYDPQLAYLLMGLAYAAYNEDSSDGGLNKNSPAEETNIYRSMLNQGFDEETVALYNYYDSPNDPAYGTDNVGFALGTQILPNGKKLVLIAVRGSFGALPDSLDWLSNFNLGDALSEKTLHAGFDAASQKVLEALEQYNGTDTENTVYVVTGHSRGAAVANLVSYHLMEKGVARENLFDYNFACPDVARLSAGDWNPDGKYNNIFNINNCSDPVGQIPGILGTIVGSLPSEIVETVINDLLPFEISGGFNWESVDSSWGKFGNTYWFSEDWNDPDKIGLDFWAHAQSRYMDYLVQLKPESYFKGWSDIELAVLLNTEWEGLFTGVFCPVDVRITDTDGNLIASVTDGRIAYGESAAFGQAIALTAGDQKVFFIHGYDDVRVELTGTDEGEMTYVCSKINLAKQTLSGGSLFQNVALTKGKLMESHLCINALESADLFITDGAGNACAQVMNDGSEIALAENIETDESGIIAENESLSETQPSHALLYCAIGFAVLVAIALIVVCTIKKAKKKNHEA